MSHHHTEQSAPGHRHDDEDTERFFTQEFWEDRYREGNAWSGNPNPVLVQHVTPLTPGTALDVGSGEGADAIWLATRGWRVTGADWSSTGLESSARTAAAAGADIAERITWRQADVRTWDPAPERFDLVSAQFMHLPRTDLHALHRRLAAAVRPGGTLLVVSHHPADRDPSVGRPGSADLFATGEEMAAVLDPAAWAVVEASAPERVGPGPDGRETVLRDAVLRAVRKD
ncbi:class I SAM-dependent methyltransferase [Streptomyces sp. NPDC101181]|uniref:class I SAM-dependent methyltransferase n=1 Tax=Streptomyces sp. NPDC101181 TaxID=3366125 RepID=UPI0037F9BD5A